MIDSVCPSNNKPIAAVVQGNVKNFDTCVEESVKAWEIWADVNKKKAFERQIVV